MTPKQSRMARAGLGFTVQALAKLARVSPATVTHFEKGRDAKTSTVNTLRDAFIATGRVEFEGNNGVFVQDDIDTSTSDLKKIETKK